MRAFTLGKNLGRLCEAWKKGWRGGEREIYKSGVGRVDGGGDEWDGLGRAGAGEKRRRRG